MQVKVTDKVLIDIYRIKNISSISLYSVVESNEVLPGLVVFFGDGKQLNLCAADKYFPEFVRKVVQVYEEEKQKRPDNPFKETAIDIDEHTKEILESGALEKVNESLAFYDAKKGYDNKLSFEIDEVRLLLPIIKYHLKELFSHTDKVINWNDDFSGYRTNYSLSASVSGLETDVFITIAKANDMDYHISIRGLTPNNSGISMEIFFSEYGISVAGTIPRYEMTYSYEYRPSGGIIKKQSSITLGEKVIDYQDTNLTVMQESQSGLTTFDGAKSLDWYTLPWQGFIGIHENIRDLSEDEIISSNRVEYFYPEEKGFTRREFISEMYSSPKTKITMMRASKSINGYLWDPKNKLYVIETSFLDDISGSGYYDEHLSGKSFYHICKLKDLKALVPSDLVSIDEDKGILVGSDLMNKQRLLSLIKGDK